MAGDIERGLGPADARRVIERLREHGVLWVEEPLAGDDLAGMRSLRSPGRANRRRRDGAHLRGAAPRAGGRCARRLPARRGALARHLRRAHARRAGAAAQPLVHAAHLDQRDRPARQPARLRRRRRRTVPRVSLRPARVDAGTARLHARRAGRVDADGRLLACPTPPGSGSCSTRRRWRSTRAAVGAEDRGVHRRAFVPRPMGDLRRRLAARRDRPRIVAAGSGEDIDRAVRAARRSFEDGGWALADPAQRRACCCAWPS